MTSSTPYAAPLRVKPRSSPSLLFALLVIHAGALLLLPILDLPAWLLFAFALLVGASGGICYRRFVSRATPDAIVWALWDTEGQWWLMLNDGREVEAKLRTDSFVSPVLTVLNFVTEENRQATMVILPDNIDTQLFRQLRVRLRVERNETNA